MMKTNNPAWALLLVLVLLFCSCGAEQPPDAPDVPPETLTEELAPATARMRSLYYDRELVQRGISEPRPYAPEGGTLTAGMVPHHLVASDMIAGFFKLAGQRETAVETVLIVSPSHFPENCPGDVVTATAGWETPFGSVEADVDLAHAILADRAIDARDSAADVEYDHGAAGLIPFVRHYLPDARVTVLLLSNKLSQARLDAVCDQLAQLCADEGVLLVASADCSHYLTPAEALLRDEETAEAIESFDYHRIASFKDANVDSPQALRVLLSVAESKGAALEQLDHSSSPEKLGLALTSPVYDEGITTYFVYGAVAGE